MPDPWEQNISGGLAALEKGNAKQAFKQFQAALRRGEGQGDPSRIQAALTFIAQVHLARSDFSQETLSLLLRAKSISEESFAKSDFRIALSNLNLAVYYNFTEQPDLALSHSGMAIDFVKAAPMSREQHEMLQSLVQYQAGQSDEKLLTELWDLYYATTIHVYGPVCVQALVALTMYLDILKSLGRAESEEYSKLQTQLSDMKNSMRNTGGPQPREMTLDPPPFQNG